MFKKGAHYKESFVVIKGIKQRLYNVWVKFSHLVDLSLDFVKIAKWYLNALNDLLHDFGATFATGTPPQTQITLIKPAISIRYKLLDFVACQKLINTCL